MSCVSELKLSEVMQGSSSQKSIHSIWGRFHGVRNQETVGNVWSCRCYWLPCLFMTHALFTRWGRRIVTPHVLHPHHVPPSAKELLQCWLAWSREGWCGILFFFFFFFFKLTASTESRKLHDINAPTACCSHLPTRRGRRHTPRFLSQPNGVLAVSSVTEHKSRPSQESLPIVKTGISVKVLHWCPHIKTWRITFCLSQRNVVEHKDWSPGETFKTSTSFLGFCDLWSEPGASSC